MCQTQRRHGNSTAPLITLRCLIMFSTTTTGMTDLEVDIEDACEALRSGHCYTMFFER
jgi:hypothetical protein